MMLSWSAETPSPAVGSPTVSRGGQNKAQGSPQVLTSRLSGVKRYWVRPERSVRMVPRSGWSEVSTKAAVWMGPP